MFFHAAMAATGEWVVSVKAGEATLAQGRAASIAEAREMARKALAERTTVRPSANVA